MSAVTFLNAEVVPAGLQSVADGVQPLGGMSWDRSVCEVWVGRACTEHHDPAREVERVINSPKNK